MTDPVGIRAQARYACAAAAAIGSLLAGVAAASTLDAGLGHNLVITSGGKVVSWGANHVGQLGNGTTLNSSIPVRVSSLSTMLAVSVGNFHSVALRSDGTVWTWGAGPSLGVSPAPQTCLIPDTGSATATYLPCAKTPVQVALAGASAVAAGGGHTLALLGNGMLVAWGSNSRGQLGDGTQTSRATPVPVSGISNVVAIAAGDDFSLAIKIDGTLWAWGNGTHGELGIGTLPVNCSGSDVYNSSNPAKCLTAPTRITALSNVTTVSARGRHALALTSDGTVWAWGSGRYGQLGDGARIDRLGPIAVPGMSGAVWIAAGFSHSIVVKGDGKFWAFGLNHFAQLGSYDSDVICTPGIFNACELSPVAVSQYNGATDIAAGGAHTLVRRADGTFATFGRNDSGQLGHGLSPTQLVQVNFADPHSSPGAGSQSSGGSLGTASSASGLNLGSDGGLRFSSPALGVSSSPIQVQFTNLQETAVAIQSIGVTGDFSHTEDCPPSLPAAPAYCTIQVTFTPTGPGERLGTLTVTTDSPDAATISLELSGTTPPVLHALTVAKSGTGSGTVTSSPAGINCGSTCAASFESTTTVDLAAAAAAGSTFAGWSGDCAATGICQLSMSAARNVTATFTAGPAGPPVADPTQVAFGNQPLGTAAVRVVTLTNPAAVAITISSVTTAAPFTVTHNCGTLGPAASCSASVTFAPPGASAFTSNLFVNASAGNLAVPLSGTGTPNPPRLGNISTRMQVGTGNDVMIGGFVIGAGASKTVAIVATGPSLTTSGIANPLVNPSLTLIRSSDQATIASNDDWQQASNAAALTAAGFAPLNPLEAAILVTLAPGAYTAIVQGADGGTGVSVIGVYEVDALTTPLINISTRGRVLTGDDVMIGGFIINGTGPQTVAVVVTGPSLAAHGITSWLANPTLTIVRSSDQATMASNDDWQAHANAAQLQAAGFAPINPLESGILITLAPGAYTAIVSGVAGGTGVAVIGVYKVN